VKKYKQARQLPTRGGLNDLGKSQRTIIDYAKATKTLPAEAAPNILQNLRKGAR
jgi:hypothetical protein